MFLPQSTYCSERVANWDPSMKIKLMFLPQSTYFSERVANFHVMMIMMCLMMMMMTTTTMWSNVRVGRNLFYQLCFSPLKKQKRHHVGLDSMHETAAAHSLFRLWNPRPFSRFTLTRTAQADVGAFAKTESQQPGHPKKNWPLLLTALEFRLHSCVVLCINLSTFFEAERTQPVHFPKKNFCMKNCSVFELSWGLIFATIHIPTCTNRTWKIRPSLKLGRSWVTLAKSPRSYLNVHRLTFFVGEGSLSLPQC